MGSQSCLGGAWGYLYHEWTDSDFKSLCFALIENNLIKNHIDIFSVTHPSIFWVLGTEQGSCTSSSCGGHNLSQRHVLLCASWAWPRIFSCLEILETPHLVRYPNHRNWILSMWMIHITADTAQICLSVSCSTVPSLFDVTQSELLLFPTETCGLRHLMKIREKQLRSFDHLCPLVLAVFQLHGVLESPCTG